MPTGTTLFPAFRAASVGAALPTQSHRHAPPPSGLRPAGHLRMGRSASHLLASPSRRPLSPAHSTSSAGASSPELWLGFSSSPQASKPRPLSATSLFPGPVAAPPTRLRLPEATPPTPTYPAQTPPTSGGAAPPSGRSAPPTPPASGRARRSLLCSPSLVRLRLPHHLSDRSAAKF